jgi:Short repeat of unknown function (DUF308)
MTSTSAYAILMHPGSTSRKRVHPARRGTTDGTTASLWDAFATVLELRLTGNSHALDRVRLGNVALSVAAAAAMLIAVFSTIKATLIVFGAWALLSGAVQLTLAIRRRRSVGAQWPMMLSGGIPILAGINFVATSGSGSAGLLKVAGYSAFGAFWFLVAVVALRRSRTADAAGRTTDERGRLADDAAS